MKTSVVLATYNGQKFLNDQILSIVNQTIVPDEILVFDDQSTDNTMNIIMKYVRNYPKINWKVKVNSRNQGFKNNFHQLINSAQGDIIFLSDQDDIWNHNKIEKMINEFKNNSQIKVLVTDFTNLVMSDGIKDRNAEKIICGKKIKENLFFVELRRENYLNARPGWTFAFKSEVRDLYNEIFELSNELYHDEVLWYSGLLLQGLYYFKFNSGYWRRFGDSVTALNSDEKKVERFMNLLGNRKERSCDLVKIYKLAKRLGVRPIQKFGIYVYFRNVFFKIICKLEGWNR